MRRPSSADSAGLAARRERLSWHGHPTHGLAVRREHRLYSTDPSMSAATFASHLINRRYTQINADGTGTGCSSLPAARSAAFNPLQRHGRLYTSKQHIDEGGLR